MTFLPIVMRELRVAARRRRTHWVRLLVAFAAIIVGGAILLLYQQGTPPELVGGYIFKGLTTLSMLYCLISGRLTTTDCISEEKREGTLGLLFLTDLKGYDVVFGKLVATSLNSFYGLLAVFPVLAIPLLLGGVANAEFWRIALVLVTTFLFSLAIAMFCSAISADARRAVAANFVLNLGLNAALPAIAGIIFFLNPARVFVPELLFSSPVYACILGFDAPYKLRPDAFWWSIAVIHGLTWLLLLLACRIVPRSWQDKPIRAHAGKSGWRERWYAWSYGKVEKRPAFRKQLLDLNAYYWLAGRARLKPIHVWTFLGLLAIWWLVGWFTSGSAWLDEVGNVTTALILNTTLKLWITLEAGQRLAEDQKAGAFELLLPTPLTSREILSGQWLALRRQFLWPLLVVIAVELLLMQASLLTSIGSSVPILTLWMAGIVMLVADVVALTWVAMRIALTAKSPSHTTIGTVTRVLILPWVVFGMVFGIATFWHFWTDTVGPFPAWSPSWKFNIAWWFALGILADLVFGFTARWQLLTSFRRLAMHRHEHRSSRFSRSVTPPVATSTEPTNLRSSELAQPINAPKQRISRRRNAVIFASVLVLILVAWWFRSSTTKFPPPVIVSISHSNAPLRVFPGWDGVFFVLPDGSLWRWGQTGESPSKKAVVPEQVGTNTDWLQVVGSFNHFLGVRRDGTLWEWGWRIDPTSLNSSMLVREPERVDSGHHWVSVAVGVCAAALKDDGTLWTWGHNAGGQLGNGPGPDQVNPIQVGTNRNWMAVQSRGSYILALRIDGTLWVWGQFFPDGGTSLTYISIPTQVCRETNWVAFTSSPWSQVRNRSGELWRLASMPDADAAAGVTCRLVLSNAPPDRVAATVGGDAPKLFEIRGDGTLWERGQPMTAWDNQAPVSTWRRVGKRSDWVSIWGSYTVVGLTADGTIWTWGIDPSQEPVLDNASRIKLLRERVNSLFGSSGAPGGVRSTFAVPRIQKQPRPILRLVPSQLDPASAGR